MLSFVRYRYSGHCNYNLYGNVTTCIQYDSMNILMEILIIENLLITVRVEN